MSHCSTSFYYTLQSNDFPHRVFFLFIDYFYVKKKYPGGHITLYYGSQTGTAETFAKDIEREGEENGFKMEVIDLEDIEDDILASVLKEQKKDDRGKNRAIFVMATYGEGEPTDNAVSFMRFLKNGSTEDEMDDGEEKKGDDFLNQNTSLFLNLEYAVFGLGNRQYEHFNSTGKQVDSFLERGGALRIAKLGLGDDDNDLEGDFENWKDSILWPKCISSQHLAQCPSVSMPLEHILIRINQTRCNRR